MTTMNRLPTALGLIAALAFSMPSFQVNSAEAAAAHSGTKASASATSGKKTVHNQKHCKATKTHKCPVSKKKPKKAM